MLTIKQIFQDEVRYENFFFFFNYNKIKRKK